ncbi:hypothetical protein MBSD_n0079 [Mizugakiibacter sediminis]|uniref:DUF4340 domain-containing protein n=1 Tax=Mizugakiibacter sediminis TaxID=1475481 RepID=A0A0K8QJY4_9GAMM|nr:hypothetical protein [Mizugakiibacter sediminis]GAP64797.1 hypothetical protein MBSD_n0079 [Mizugakiibacter sediminis]
MRRVVVRRLALAAGVAALLAAAAWQLRQERTASPDTLLALDPAAVTRVEVQMAGGPPRRFERRDGHWWMTAPQAGRADDAHLADLAAIAAAPALQWRPLSDFAPAKIGLAPPAATLTLDGETLRFGTLAPFARARYVQVGARIALVPDRYTPYLAVDPQRELAAPATR